LCSIIFFIQGAAHYVCAIRHKNEFIPTTTDESSKKFVDGWFLTNDHVVSFIPNENFYNLVQQCFPTLLAYEQINQNPSD
jgi:DNA anti-recombination protein RmuC